MFTSNLRFFICIVASGGFLMGCKSDNKLQWNEEDGYRWAEVNSGIWRSIGFKNVPSSKSNIHFCNDLRQELKEENRTYLNGSGVTAADINGNGLTDIYFASLEGPNKLYENLGNFRFRDITEEAGVAHDGIQLYRSCLCRCHR
jgi:enediyne biosynthesis protein E4